MNNKALQLAKREWHGFFGSRQAWLGAVAAGLILGLAGPFGTFDQLSLPLRLPYWVCVAVLTYLTGSIVSALLFGLVAGPVALQIGLAAIFSSLAITLELVVMNGAWFSIVPDVAGVLALGGYVFLATLVILLTRQFLTAPVPAQTKAQIPALLQRLPLSKRDGLVSLSAVDHYVDVKTQAGNELVLMRFADAVAETAPEPGVRIHRSHWVAVAAVADVKRVKGKGQAMLKDGTVLPVSRTFWPDLKELGLVKSGGADG